MASTILQPIKPSVFGTNRVRFPMFGWTFVKSGWLGDTWRQDSTGKTIRLSKGVAPQFEGYPDDRFTHTLKGRW
jgi:hypothetical protein